MIYLFLAEGFEEVEALTPLDYLKRSGLEIYSVGVGSKLVKGAHGICFETDLILSECSFQLQGGMLILPGGLKGTENLNSNKQVIDLVVQASKVGSLAAICAAPSILGRLNILNGKKACCYPGFEKFLVGAEVVFDDVVVCDNVITSRGPGTAQQFSFKIVEFLMGEQAKIDLQNQVQWKLG